MDSFQAHDILLAGGVNFVTDAVVLSSGDLGLRFLIPTDSEGLPKERAVAIARNQFARFQHPVYALQVLRIDAWRVYEQNGRAYVSCVAIARLREREKGLASPSSPYLCEHCGERPATVWSDEYDGEVCDPCALTLRVRAGTRRGLAAKGGAS